MGVPPPHQIHAAAQHHAGHRSQGGPPLPGPAQHRQNGQRAAQGDALPQLQGLQGHEEGTQQHQQPPPPRRSVQPHLAALTEGHQRPPVAPGRPRSEQPLQNEGAGLRRPPAALGQQHRPGEEGESAPQRRHDPGPAEPLDVVKGEGHREGEHRRRGVAQPLGKAQHAQIAEAAAQQGSRPPQPRPGRRRHGHPEGGTVLRQLHPRQHRREQKTDGCLRPQAYRRHGKPHLPRLPGLPPQPGQLMFHGLSGCHARLLRPLVRCKCRPADFIPPHYIPFFGKYPSNGGCRRRADSVGLPGGEGGNWGLYFWPKSNTM